MSDVPAHALLDVRGLRSWFETSGGLVRAVEGVSLHVGEGERVGIVGESGSGKTQTFFALLGLAHGYPGVVAGTARLGKVDLLGGLDAHVRVTPSLDHPHAVVHKESERWRRLQDERLRGVLGRDVSILFQDPRRSLIPYWTIGRHLDETLRRRTGAHPAPGRAADLLARLGFEQPSRILSSFPEQLSGGQAQRAMLALTMAMEPRLLVADEPTTGLDTINQGRALEQLQRVQEEAGLALVLISHDLSVVAQMVDRVVVMFGGRVMERTSASLLLQTERAGVACHPYTQALRESQQRRAAGLPIVPGRRAPALRRDGAGCPFAQRCSLRRDLSPMWQSRCDAEFPPELEVQPGQHVACWGKSA